MLSGGNAVLDRADNPVGSPVHGLTAGYQVESASSASGPWTLLEDNGSSLLATSQFTDTGLAEGGTRYYRVRAVGRTVEAGTPPAYSAWTAPVSVSRPLPPDTTPPAAPTPPAVTAPADGTTATLTWTYNGWPGYEQDFAGYQVTRSPGPDGPFTDSEARAPPSAPPWPAPSSRSAAPSPTARSPPTPARTTGLLSPQGALSDQIWVDLPPVSAATPVRAPGMPAPGRMPTAAG